MSACLCRGGSDEPDPIAVQAREPHVAVGPGGDPERCLHPSGSAVVGGDLTDGRDAADAVVAGREPQAPVRAGGDGTGLLDPSRCPVEGIDPTVRSDPANAIAAGAGEPQVAVGTRHDRTREDDIGPGGVERGDLPARRDASDPAVEVGEPDVAVGPGGDMSRERHPGLLTVEDDMLSGRSGAAKPVVDRVPQVAVRSGGQPHGAGAVVCARECRDVAGGGDTPETAVHGGEPQGAVRPRNDPVRAAQAILRVLVERDPAVRSDATNLVAGGGKPEVAVGARNDIVWANNVMPWIGERREGWGVFTRDLSSSRCVNCRIVDGRCSGACYDRG